MPIPHLGFPLSHFLHTPNPLNGANSCVDQIEIGRRVKHDLLFPEGQSAFLVPKELLSQVELGALNEGR